VAAVTDPLNRVFSSVNDEVGRVVRASDPLGNSVRAEYDAMDRVVRATDARGGVTAITYDAHGNTLTVRDARDLASHVFTYDERSRVETYTDPLGKTETYNYDGMGNLTSKVDRENQTTAYTYDALNRLKTITYADSSTVTITWDAGNRPRQFVGSSSGAISRDYDNLDRLTREVSPQGQVDYEYDAAGRREQFTVLGETPVSYSYDAANRLTQIAQAANTVGFTYDAANRRDTVTLPNGIVGTHTFDDAGQLLSIVYTDGMTAIGDVTYTYDLAGLRIGQGGSLTKQVAPPTVASATYNAANRLTNWGGTALGYDDNGNLTSLGSNTFTWNARNELVAASNGSSAFTYDVLGRRSSRTVASVTTEYLHDGLNPALVNDDFMLGGLGLDQTYASVSSSGTTSFVRDALGSTRLLTDENGDSVATYSYSPYGKAAKTGTAASTFQFTGRENDGASELQYNRARYYSPDINRFISEDPIGLAGGLNLHAYVSGRPIDTTDPEGLEGVGPWNSPETLGSWEQDPCVNAAVIDSLLNITPGVGLIKAFLEEPTSLDIVAGGATTGALGLWWATGRSEIAANERLAHLRRWDMGRRERARLQRAMAADRSMLRGLKLASKALGIAGILVEIGNFSDAIEKCACQQ
jgi:RHS repeat-associated protein